MSINIITVFFHPAHKPESFMPKPQCLPMSNMLGSFIVQELHRKKPHLYGHSLSCGTGTFLLRHTAIASSARSHRLQAHFALFPVSESLYLPHLRHEADSLELFSRSHHVHPHREALRPPSQVFTIPQGCRRDALRARAIALSLLTFGWFALVSTYMQILKQSCRQAMTLEHFR